MPPVSEGSPGLRTHTISGRLTLGFCGILALLVLAGVTDRLAMTSLSRTATDIIARGQLEGQLAAQLSAGIARIMEAGIRGAARADTTARARFRAEAARAHAIIQSMSDREEQGSDESALLTLLDNETLALENTYSTSHQLADAGRREAAASQADSARGIALTLLTDIGRLSTVRGQRLAADARAFQTGATRRSGMVLVTLLGVLILSALVVLSTVRSVASPLRWLVAHARELSAGNLSARTTAAMPGEFAILAGALNQTGESLSRLMSGATTTTDQVATSANDLAAVSEEIAMAAGQIAEAMSEISEGAESQVHQLNTIDTTLGTIRQHADGVRRSASEVTTLAQEIELTAGTKRAEVERALAILLEVKESVQHASDEVAALDAAAMDINRLVSAVRRVAEQTNLLALNAAIEAARAGESGRGFAVVAEEVRKLAGQAEASANDITRMTATITTRVASTADAMQVGAASVGEIEHLSRNLDAALKSIVSVAARVRLASTGVSTAAEENAHAIDRGAAGISAIARTAEAHAAAAEEVSASTEQQSAASQEMTSSAGGMLQSATQLRELIRAVRTQAA